MLLTFEALLNFFATVVLSAYLHKGGTDSKHNRELLQRFYKGKWATGDVMALMRQTAKVYLNCRDEVPYPELVDYLFDGRKKATPSLRVLKGFVELRNRTWGHGADRDDSFFNGILPNNLRLLDDARILSATRGLSESGKDTMPTRYASLKRCSCH
jgi:hypothetical protein